MDGLTLAVIIQSAMIAAALFYHIYATRNESIEHTKTSMTEIARIMDAGNARADQLENKLLMFTDQNIGMQIETLRTQQRRYEDDMAAAALDPQEQPPQFENTVDGTTEEMIHKLFENVPGADREIQ